MRLGIVDVGSLSLRFDIYEVRPDGSWDLVEKLRSMPRIGEALFSTGAFSAEGKAQLTADLKRVAALAEAADVTRLQAVGTSALRDAPGVADFLGELLAATGVDVRVLSGADEARLTALGIFSNEGGLPDEVLLVDIGGGSTELTLASNGALEQCRSIPLGALRLQQSCFRDRADGYFTPNQIEHAHGIIRDELAALPMPRERATQILGSSGTMRTAERLGLGLPDNGKVVTLKRVAEFNRNFGRLTREQALRIPKMEENRVDVIFPGLLILEGIMEEFKIESTLVSHFSLRHGVLAEEINRLLSSTA